MIKATDIHKQFGSVEALRGVTLEVAQSEIVAIVGASGAGKSTLLQILGTLMPQDSGRVEIAGVDVASLDSKALARFRNRHIGFVFQFHHLLPEFTAVENVMMPSLIGGASRREAEHRAKELLEMVGMQHRATHRPSEMSGGEQQRVAIARALIAKPRVILADEPTGALDSKTSQEVIDLLRDVSKNEGITMIIVTHAPEVAEQTDRIIQIRDGVIV